MSSRAQSQFPRPWQPLREQPVRGSYRGAGYSRRGRFNGRDAGSVASFTVLCQPLIIALAGGLELVAQSTEPRYGAAGAGGLTASFVGSWMLQTAMAAGLKSAACVLRNYGESFLRDLAAWVWSVLMKAAWAAFVDWSYGVAIGWLRMFPFWPRPDRPNGPNDDSPDRRRRRPIWDWWRRRRERRRERWERR